MAKYVINPENYFTFEESSKNNNKIGKIQVDVYEATEFLENVLYTDFYEGSVYGGIEPKVKGYKSHMESSIMLEQQEFSPEFPIAVLEDVDIDGEITLNKEDFEKGNYGVTLNVLCLLEKRTTKTTDIRRSASTENLLNIYDFSSAEVTSDSVEFVDKGGNFIEVQNYKISDLLTTTNIKDVSLNIVDNGDTVNIKYGAIVKPFVKYDYSTTSYYHTVGSSGHTKDKRYKQTIEQYITKKVFVKISGKNPASEASKYVLRATSQTNPYGDEYTFNSNELIQEKSGIFGGIYGDSISISQAIATNIFNEFENGKRTATLTWCGSPYIKVWEDTVKVIPKQNYNGKEDELTEYRVHSIQNTFDGGFKQVLKLVEKGEKVYG
jgi:hypothetical protein